MDWSAFIAGGGAGAVGIRLVETYIKHRLDISKAKHDQQLRIQDEERKVLLAAQKAAAEREESHGNRLIEFENLKLAILRASNNHDLIDAYRALESFFEYHQEYLVCSEENKAFRSRYCFSNVSRTLDPPKSSNPRLQKKDVNEYAVELRRDVKGLRLPTLEEIDAFKRRRPEENSSIPFPNRADDVGH